MKKLLSMALLFLGIQGLAVADTFTTGKVRLTVPATGYIDTSKSWAIKLNENTVWTSTAINEVGTSVASSTGVLTTRLNNLDSSTGTLQANINNLYTNVTATHTALTTAINSTQTYLLEGNATSYVNINPDKQTKTGELVVGSFTVTNSSITINSIPYLFPTEAPATIDQTLTFRGGKQLTWKVPAGVGGGGGGGTQKWYLYEKLNTDIGSGLYETMLTTPSTDAQEIETVTVRASDGWKIISSHSITNAQMGNVTKVPAGAGAVHYHAKVDASVGVSQFLFRFSTSALDGVTGKDDWYSSTGTEINNTDDFASYIDGGVLTTELNLTTYTAIILEVYAKTSSVPNRTLSFAYQGSSNTAYCDTPISQDATLISLDDTPNSYSGHGGKYVKVVSSANKVEFTDEVQISTGILREMVDSISPSTTAFRLFEGTGSDKIDLALLNAATSQNMIDVITQSTIAFRLFEGTAPDKIDFLLLNVSTAENLMDRVTAFESSGMAKIDLSALFVSTAETQIDRVTAFESTAPKKIDASSLHISTIEAGTAQVNFASMTVYGTITSSSGFIVGQSTASEIWINNLRVSTHLVTSSGGSGDAVLADDQEFTGFNVFSASTTIIDGIACSSIIAKNGKYIRITTRCAIGMSPHITDNVLVSMGHGGQALADDFVFLLRKTPLNGVPFFGWDDGVNSQAIAMNNNSGDLFVYNGGGPGGGWFNTVQIQKTQPYMYILGDCDITGALSKGSGTFRFPHPTFLDKFLVHGFVESDKYGTVYDGEAQLDHGEATITMPDWYEIVNATDSRTVHLTPVDGWSPLYVEGKVKDGRFTVKTATGLGNQDQKFYWQLTGRRGDPHIRALSSSKINDIGMLKVIQDIELDDQELATSEKLDGKTDKVTNALKRKRAKYDGFKSEKDGLNDETKLKLQDK